jgi:hypothetical protein
MFYCTLIIEHDSLSGIPEGFFTDVFHREVVFRENRDRPKSRYSRVAETYVNRFAWIVHSKNRVGGDSFSEHVNFLLSYLADGKTMKQLSQLGYECEISVYWGGRGTGGGPLIDKNLIRLFYEQSICLHVGFYFES